MMLQRQKEDGKGEEMRIPSHQWVSKARLGNWLSRRSPMLKWNYLICCYVACTIELVRNQFNARCSHEKDEVQVLNCCKDLIWKSPFWPQYPSIANGLNGFKARNVSSLQSFQDGGWKIYGHISVALAVFYWITSIVTHSCWWRDSLYMKQNEMIE